MTRPSAQLYIRTGFTLLAAITLVLAVAFYRESERVDISNRWVKHTYEVIVQLNSVLAQINDISANARAYGLTGVPFYYRRYQAALEHGGMQPGTVEENLAQLRALVADNPAQLPQLERLTALLAQKMEFMRRDVALRQAGKNAAVMALVSSGEGERVMDDIRAILMRMTAKEEALLVQRRAAALHVHAVDRIIVSTAFILLLTVIGLSCVLLLRYLRRQERTETLLREVNRLQQGILNSAAYAIIAVDARGRITTFNKSAERMLGYSAQEVMGKRPEFLHIPEEVQSWSREQWEIPHRSNAEGFDFLFDNPEMFKETEREFTYVRKDGTRFPGLANVSALRDENGAVAGFMGIISDISERKEMERLKDEFISTVSHELRTPMTSIRSSLELAMEGIAGELPPKARSLIQIAYKNSDRLLRIINDILDMEKIELGNIRFDIKALNVDDVLQQAIETNRAFAQKYNVLLERLPLRGEMAVTADNDRLIQVLTNLLSNAIKFSPPDSLVTLGAERRGSSVRFMVTDQGPGVPESFQERIFTKFAQADGSDSRRSDGTGLGLSIAKSIVEHMEGAIGFDTIIGKGTTFHVDLPTPEQNKKDLWSAYKIKSDIASSKHILICEDDNDVAYLLQLMLEQEGFSCDIAFTVAEAWGKLDTNHYDAMTLDLILPDGDGISFIRQLRSIPRHRYLPVIVVSVRADEGRTELNGEAVAIVDWLVKPIDPMRLRGALRHVASGAFSIKPRILYLEHDKEFSQLIDATLRNEADIDAASTPEEAAARLREVPYDLVILDLNSSHLDIDLLPQLSLSAGKVPMVMIFSPKEPGALVNQRIAAALASSAGQNKIAHVVRTLIEKKS